jgi:hypothetical protein
MTRLRLSWGIHLACILFFLSALRHTAAVEGPILGTEKQILFNWLSHVFRLRFYLFIVETLVHITTGSGPVSCLAVFGFLVFWFSG